MIGMPVKYTYKIINSNDSGVFLNRIQTHQYNLLPKSPEINAIMSANKVFSPFREAIKYNKLQDSIINVIQTYMDSSNILRKKLRAIEPERENYAARAQIITMIDNIEKEKSNSYKKLRQDYNENSLKNAEVDKYNVGIDFW